MTKGCNRSIRLKCPDFPWSMLLGSHALSVSLLSGGHWQIHNLPPFFQFPHSRSRQEPSPSQWLSGCEFLPDSLWDHCGGQLPLHHYSGIPLRLWHSPCCCCHSQPTAPKGPKGNGNKVQSRLKLLQADILLIAGSKGVGNRLMFLLVLAVRIVFKKGCTTASTRGQ